MFGQYGILFIKVNLRLNCFVKIEKNASGTTPFLKLHFVVSANDFLPAFRRILGILSISILFSNRLFESVFIRSLIPPAPCLNPRLFLDIRFLHDLFLRYAYQSHF